MSTPITQAAFDLLPTALQRLWAGDKGYSLVSTLPLDAAERHLIQMFVVQATEVPSAYVSIPLRSEGGGNVPYVHAPKTVLVESITEVMKTGALGFIENRYTKKGENDPMLRLWASWAWIYGLRNMDVAWVDMTDPANPKLYAVNGNTDLAMMAYRPMVVDRNLTENHISQMTPANDRVALPRNDFPQLIGDFATERFPLESVTTSDGSHFRGVREGNLIAPIGNGSVGLIIAEGGTGKSRLIVEYFCSSAGLTLLSDDYEVVALSLGERQGDIKRMLDVLKSVPHDPRKVELFFCGATGRSHWLNNLALMAVERALRLTETGKKVILIVDSFSRWERAASSTIYADRLLQGGIPPEVLDMVRTAASAGANYSKIGWGGLTILGTMLGPGDSTTRVESAEGALVKHVADSGSTTMMRLMRIASNQYPKWNVFSHQTYTRSSEEMLTARQIAEAQACQAFMWGNPDGDQTLRDTSDPKAALARLHVWADEHPIPPDVPGWDGTDWWTPYLSAKKR